MEYILKSSVLIIAFYLCYKLLLQKDTFFESNRWFFSIGIITSFLLPLVIIPIYIIVQPQENSFVFAQEVTSGAIQETIKNPFNWDQFIIALYFLGVSIFGVRLLIQLFSLASLIYRNDKYRSGKFIYVKVADNISPFSFFNWIVFNPNQFKEEELDQIITHEKVHASQYHSVDILLIQIATVLFWCNPFVWLYKKAMQQNLEFIADAETQKLTYSDKSYQQLLLKTSVPNYQMAFTNNFYNSLIKKRIVMLHKSKSHKRNQWKFTAIIPLLALFLMSFSTKEVFVEAPNPNPVFLTPEDTNVQKSENREQAFSPVSNTASEVVEMIITKNTSDDDLNDLKKQFKEHHVTLKFSGIKRNSDEEILKIAVSASSKNSKAKYEADSDKPISPITIKYDSEDNSIMIGSHSNSSHGMHYTYNDKKHKIKTHGKGSNVFVHSDYDEDGEHEVIIERNGKKRKFKTKKSSIHVISDDDHEEIIDIDDENIFIISPKSKHKKSLSIYTGKGKNPLIFLDGKKITKKEMEALDTDTIESIDVSKGEKAKKKYGKKAKDGVINITTKD